MITADSPLLAPARASEAQAKAYIVGRGSVYTPQDIETIVGHYWRYAPPAGLDPLMAIAQAIHETSERDPATDKWRPLSSWWAQRPRRNPAGLGVTGQMRATQPVDVKAWQQDTRPQPPVWRAGLAFDSWDISSRAHIGRLLAYSVPAGAETPAQIELINFALAFRPLPTNLRGTAPTAKMLGARFNPTGRGWATPGTNYGEKIAQVAQEITQA